MIFVSMAPKSWPERAVERFLENIKQHPCLFDKKDENFANDIKKQSVWKEIANNCGRPVLEVQKKWKGLKDTFTKRKKAQDTPEAAVAIANGTYVETWPYFLTMHQLIGSKKKIVVNIMDLNASSNQNSNQTEVGVFTDAESEDDAVTDAVDEAFRTLGGVQNQITTSSPLKRKRFDISPLRSSPDDLNDFSESAAILNVKSDKPENSDDIAGFMLIIKTALKRIPLEDREDIIFKLHGEFRNVIKQYHLRKNINGDASY
uniref:MADF domain-containing protein n=1 Tax=Strigamia maritima TaxID=126957 RepID=T1JGK2_STRMM